MLRTYRYRIYPTRWQEMNLWHVMDACRGLYNMALAERKYAYQLERRSVSTTALYELAKRYRRKALRAVQRQQEHVACQRRDLLHKLSTGLVRTFDRIALEDLRVRTLDPLGLLRLWSLARPGPQRGDQHLASSRVGHPRAG